MTTRSSLLAVGIMIATRMQEDIYVSPPAVVTIVKSCMLATNVPSDNVQLYVRHGSGVTVLIFSHSFAAGGTPFEWLPWFVLEPNSVLVLSASAGQVHFYVSGAQLPVP